MDALNAVADRQVVLSQTADALKRKVDLARSAVLLLSIMGAACAGIAAALQADDGLRHVLTVAGTIALFAAGALTAAFLTGEARQRPIHFRSGSEALKREAYSFAAGAGDYGSPDPGPRLLAALERVDVELKDLAGFEVRPRGQGSCPRGALNRDAYVRNRIDKQIDFYRDRAGRHARSARRLHAVAWLLSVAAGLITAVSGLLGPAPFDLAAVTGILTTVAAALISHIQAQKFDEMVVGYRAAARALERLKAGISQQTAGEVAAAAEAIVAEETGSWQALFLKDSSPGK